MALETHSGYSQVIFNSNQNPFLKHLKQPDCTLNLSYFNSPGYKSRIHYNIFPIAHSMSDNEILKKKKKNMEG